MRTFTLGAMLWSVAMIAACFAAYRIDVRAAPLIATVYSAYFLFGLHTLQRSSRGRHVRIGAVTASAGVVAWMVVALSLDWIVYLQTDAAIDLRTISMTFLVNLAFVIGYGVFGLIVGSFYGLLAYAVRRGGNS